MIFYLLHSAILFTVLFMPWILLFRKQTHFQWQRFYILICGIISLLLPMTPVSEQFQLAYPFELPVYIAGDTQANDAVSALTSLSLSEIIYVSGVVLFACLFCIKVWRLVRITGNSQKVADGIYSIKTATSPIGFSVFRRIYISDKIEDESRECIIKHELVHVRQMHSLDIFFFEFLLIFFWFNPLYWLARRELVLTHEFIADEQACGDDVVRYKQILVAHMLGLPRQALIHSFSDPGKLKRRMTMMTNPKSSARSRWCYLISVPFLTMTLFLNTMSFTSCKDAESTPATVAEFKGGTDAMMKFLADNIVYPDDAKEAQQEGTVYIAFTISPDGKVTNAKVMKSVYPSLDNEGLRVINAMPDWTPGEENGEKVASEMTLPIRFSLQ